MFIYPKDCSKLKQCLSYMEYDIATKVRKKMLALVMASAGGSLKIFEGWEKIRLRGYLCFDPLVYCLWTILLLSLIFLSFSVTPVVFLPKNFRGDIHLH